MKVLFNLIQMEINWEAYFPMPNERNIERLTYLLEIKEEGMEIYRDRRPELLSRRFNYILNYLGEELLCNCVGVHITSAYKVKLFWNYNIFGNNCQLWILDKYKVHFMHQISTKEGNTYRSKTRKRSTDNITLKELLDDLKLTLKTLKDGN